MFIPTIYIENSNDNMSVEVSDKKLHHLNKVLRLRDGDKINISNGKGLISVSYTHLTLPTIPGV